MVTSAYLGVRRFLAIVRFEQVRPRLARESYVERALRTLRLCAAAGTTAVRSHVDVAVPPEGRVCVSEAVEALLEVRERVRELIDVQIVLLPGGNIAHDHDLYEVCEEALRLGADAVGGAPALHEDPIAMVSAAFDLAARARALRQVAENAALAQKEFDSAFVLMQYFGYLRRDPNTGPDTNFDGYNFWLTKLDTFKSDFRQAEMVKAFLIAGEYRGRFPR